MSRIYFHSEDDCAEVRGSERAYAGCLTNDIGVGLILSQFTYEMDRLYAGLGDSFGRDEKRLRLMLNVDSTSRTFALADGTHARVWPVILNTCLRVGSGPLRLLTRLHAQCEIHAWVDDPNKEWLAEIVDEGLRDGLMRKDSGWESVSEMLRRVKGPVVTSYSVCESFPNAHVADWSPPIHDEGGEDEELEWDAWYDIDDADRWALAMKGLRASSSGLELKPDNFDVFGFGAGLSALGLRARLPELAK
jgi:hypothetical protein